MTGRKRFLFLQGVCSPFFPRLAEALRQAGHTVRKINFTVGDSVYWRKGDSTAYRGPMAGLGSFYARQFELNGITDIVLFGDCRPVHRPAIELAKTLGIEVHVFEEGYFRPYWITLERQGVNGHSQLPKDPDWYRQQARSFPKTADAKSFESPFWKRAVYDVGYNFWSGLNPLLHRGVRSHVPYSPAVEYLHYLKRGMTLRSEQERSRAREIQLITEAEHAPFYLLPLQLASDAQILHHSPFADMLEALYKTLTSFAAAAPENSRLAIKIHPLDPGIINYQKTIAETAKKMNIRDRVFYLGGGHLPTLLTHTRGVVTVNSTVGMSSIVHGKATKCLGNAIYDLESMTYQGSLDDFWTSDFKPSSSTFRAFRKVVMSLTQINGGFYTESSIDLAVENSIPKILSRRY